MDELVPLLLHDRCHHCSGEPILLPHEVVRGAAGVVRTLAEQFRRAGEPLNAAYFDRVAEAADARAVLLHDVAESSPGFRRILSGRARPLDRVCRRVEAVPHDPRVGQRISMDESCAGGGGAIAPADAAPR